MNKIVLIVSLLGICFVCLTPKFSLADSCVVEKVIGARVSQGTYKVNVTRESDDLYQVTGQNIYIKTRYCYKYIYYQDAILEVESPSGYSIGQIYFK